MSIVAEKVGSMPDSRRPRAQPCCSPMIAGIITSTPSIASRRMPASSMARFSPRG
jgi:hypothetical protein